MDNTVKPQENTAQAGKTFTQDELNSIVGKRLAEEKARFADYDSLKEKAAKYDEAMEASKSDSEKLAEALARAKSLEDELKGMKQEAKIRGMREKVAAEKKIPVNLLTANTEEECIEQANALLEFAKPQYPKVKDGGEVPKTTSGTTADHFAEWFNKSLS